MFNLEFATVFEELAIQTRMSSPSRIGGHEARTTVKCPSTVANPLGCRQVILTRGRLPFHGYATCPAPEADRN